MDLRTFGPVYTVRLSLPPPELHPNSRYHWRAQIAPRKAYRHEACIAAKQAISEVSRAGERPVLKHVLARATFYFATNRRRDRTNLSASLKAAWDGLQDAGLVRDDSGIIELPPVLRVDRSGPRVILNVRATRLTDV